MSSKQITMSYEEYQQDLAASRELGWEEAKERLKKLMKLTKEEIEMQSYMQDDARGPELAIVRDIFEYFFLY